MFVVLEIRIVKNEESLCLVLVLVYEYMSSCVRKEVQDKTLFRQLEGFVCAFVCCGDDSHGRNCERERGIIVCCFDYAWLVVQLGQSALRGTHTIGPRIRGPLRLCFLYSVFG